MSGISQITVAADIDLEKNDASNDASFFLMTTGLQAVRTSIRTCCCPVDGNRSSGYKWVGQFRREHFAPGVQACELLFVDVTTV